MKILEVNSSKQNINDIYLKYISYKTLCLKILSDNEEIDKFISSHSTTLINNKNFLLFLNTNNLKSLLESLYKKTNSESILSGEKEFLYQSDLTSSERRLMFYLFILNKQSTYNNKAKIFLNEIKNISLFNNFEELIENVCNVIPYYDAINNIRTTGISCSDYNKFFNYKTLAEISTGLFTLKHLTGAIIAGSIGVIKDDLNCFINECFTPNGFEMLNKELYDYFCDLNDKFKYLE